MTCLRFTILLLFATVFALQAKRLVIKSRIGNGAWLSKKAVYPLKGQQVQLKVDSIPGGEISWYQIIPDCENYYKNANHPWEPDPYKWVGFARIKYYKEELTSSRSKWVITPRFQNKSFTSHYFNLNVGSFWIQAVVKVNGKAFASPGVEDADHRGLSPKVFRVSLRESKGYIGYLTSYYNVPGLFGSIPYQCSNYIGADCADVLMAAYTRFNGKSLTKDYNVAMLVNSLKKVARFTMEQGSPDRKIEWKKQIVPGDLIAVRYEKGKQFQHIGALYKDNNNNGILDPDDLFLHAGPYSLSSDDFRVGSFDGTVVILRFQN